jgi:DNA-directed RNA polymerase specialized sigma subunit
MNARTLGKRLQLDSLERRVVMLHFTEQLTMAETAEVLGLTEYHVELILKSITDAARAIIDENP